MLRARSCTRPILRLIRRRTGRADERDLAPGSGARESLRGYGCRDDLAQEARRGAQETRPPWIMHADSVVM